jgi:hypothetical protein
VNHAPSASAGEYPPFEATSPAGATVALSGSGVDPDPGDVLAFHWTNGSTTLGTGASITTIFPIGTHDVTLTVTDRYGAATTSATGVAVVDTTPPILTVPGQLVVDADRPSGRPVAYQATAVDVADAVPTLTCLPAAGGVFPIGTTTVRCTAQDDSANSTSRTFSIRVRGPADQIVSLIEKTLRFLDSPALEATLRAVLKEVAAAVVGKRPEVACRALNAYLAAVTQAGSKVLTAAEKSALIADASRVQAVIGCK